MDLKAEYLKKLRRSNGIDELLDMADDMHWILDQIEGKGYGVHRKPSMGYWSKKYFLKIGKQMMDTLQSDWLIYEKQHCVYNHAFEKTIVYNKLNLVNKIKEYWRS